MNLSPEWRLQLENIGEAVHWSTVGAYDAPDSVILAYAREKGYCVVTNDLDFGTILASTHLRSPSVFQIRSHVLDPGSIGEAVLKCLRAVEPDLDQGALVSFDLTDFRVRMLPIT